MTDCIIVGGGLIGMLTARELHQAGVRVVLIERGELGGESTWAGGGILSPLYPWRYTDAVNRLATYSQQLYPDIAEQLYRESGVDPQYTRSGMLILDAQQDAQADAWARQWHMSLQHLHDQNLHDCEPALDSSFTSGLYLSEIAQLRNPRLVKALRGSLLHHGVVCHEHTEVTGLQISTNTIRGITTNRGRFSADRVIVAGGAWSRDIIGRYGQPPAIEPVKGQMIVFRGEPGMLRRMILFDNRYVIPRRDGRILAGSTLEYTGFEKQTTEEALHRLRASAIEMVPSLQGLVVEHHWSGLRPGSPSGIPYICEHPQIHGLYLNSGHFRNGVVLGAASCRLMRDLILGKEGDISPLPYALSAQR